MRKMKDSRIEWIGEIPKDWNMVPYKRIMHKIKAICEHYNGEDIISLTMNGVIKRDLTAGGKMPTSFDGYQYVEPEDLLLCLFDIDVTPRCVGIVRDYGVTSPAYSRFRVHDGYSNRYYDYLLRAIDDDKVFVHLSKNLRSSLTETDFGAIKTCAPPLTEQGRIAAFLDAECAEIDAVLEKTRASIDEYKKLKQTVIPQAVTKGIRGGRPMKDSGIKWIGEIPADWKTAAIKRGFTLVAGATPKSEISEYWDGEICWITPADYKTEDYYIHCGRRCISKAGLESCATQIIPKNCIIFSKRAPIGSVAITANQLCTNQGCIALIPCVNVDIRYYYFALSAFTEQFNLLGSGTTFKEISASNFADFKLPHLSIEEQKEIADYLDAKCFEINNLISKKQQYLTEIENYKKSLIYEYVTGKKEVI